MGRASREKRERREGDRRRLLADLAAGGKLDMITRVEGGEEVTYIHIPEEHCWTTRDITRYLLSCLPDAAPGERHG